MTFGEKLQGLRQKAGMSQDALAEKLNVSRQAVSRWERDETMPETDKVVVLANLFGVTTDCLLRDLPPQERQAEQRAAQPPQGDCEAQLKHLVKTRGYLLGWLPVVWGVLCLVLTALLGVSELHRWKNMRVWEQETGMDMSAIPSEHPSWVIILALLIGIVFLIVGICVLRTGKRRAKRAKRERR